MNRTLQRLRGVIARCAIPALGALAASGCHEGLIATPYVMYGEAGRKVFEQTPEHLRVPDMSVLYVTDRKADKVGPNGPVYGYVRSPALEFGVATCSFGANVTWDELVADSTGPKRSHEYVPKVTSVERTGSFSPLAQQADIIDGRIVVPKTLVDAFGSEQQKLDATVARWLDHTDRKEAVVFIHGFNNSFDDAVLRLAEAWHFSGRVGVPIVFTWPAGSPGLLGAYQHDRESGEYANLHLKLLLISLARNPQIERIHIISHSRGTDVATTALRELNAEVRAGLGRGLVVPMLGLAKPGATLDPRLPYEVLKIDTLVLAAPDLDLDVFTQRFVGDNVLNAARRTVIYFSEHDEALSWADWLFNSRRRVGNIRISDLAPESREKIERLTAVELINCNVTGGSTHSYVLQHPAALSDLLLLLRDRRPPGAANGRPLKVPFKGFWELTNEYMKPVPSPSHAD